MTMWTAADRQRCEQRLRPRLKHRLELLWQRDPSLRNRVEQAQQLELATRGDRGREVKHEPVPVNLTEEERRQLLADVLTISPAEVTSDQLAQFDLSYPLAQLRRQQQIEERVLTEDPVGREILQLRRELEHLTETLALVADGQDLKRFWREILRVLDQTPTRLQQVLLVGLPPLHIPSKSSASESSSV